MPENLPAGWVSTTIGDISTVIQGQSPPGSTYNTDGIGLPFLQGKAEFGEMYPEAVKWCSAPSKIAEPNDVLLSIRAPVGPTNLCSVQSCIGRGLAAIRTQGDMPAKFILYAMRATEDELRAKSTGTTFEAIRGDNLSSHSLPLPPLNEQRRIVEEIERRFSLIQKAEDMVGAKLKKAERLRQSILKQAFSGRLVPQDPSDEPASELLERIRAEREAAETAEKNEKRSKTSTRHEQRTRRTPKGRLRDDQSFAIGQKLWNYSSVLRDAGLSYGDYLEQLTYLLFLKMMHERTQPPYTLLPDYTPPPIPEGFDWPSLLERDGDELETHYRHALEALAKEPGTLGVIFGKAQNKIQEPAMLTRLIKDLIDADNWTSLSADVKGDAYESLLERNAQDVKTGAGQYFTPRALIQAIVDVMRPGPDIRICDPACGTAGFLLAAHDYIVENNKSMDQGQLQHLQNNALHGWEIVDNAARMGVMNLYLHGIGGDETNIIVDDALRAQPGKNFDMVLTNPPFGRSQALPLSTRREWQNGKRLLLSALISGRRRATNS